MKQFYSIALLTLYCIKDLTLPLMHSYFLFSCIFYFRRKKKLLSLTGAGTWKFFYNILEVLLFKNLRVSHNYKVALMLFPFSKKMFDSISLQVQAILLSRFFLFWIIYFHNILFQQNHYIHIFFLHIFCCVVRVFSLCLYVVIVIYAIRTDFLWFLYEH